MGEIESNRSFSLGFERATRFSASPTRRLRLAAHKTHSVCPVSCTFAVQQNLLYDERETLASALKAADSFALLPRRMRSPETAVGGRDEMTRGRWGLGGVVSKHKVRGYTVSGVFALVCIYCMRPSCMFSLKCSALTKCPSALNSKRHKYRDLPLSVALQPENEVN